MKTTPLKALSIEQLETAFASAVSEITNTRTIVTIGLIRQLGDQLSRLSGKESFMIDMTVATGSTLGETMRITPSLLSQWEPLKMAKVGSEEPG